MSDAVADTQYGRVSGRKLDDRMVWRGIPYARPPVGPLRYRPPEPPEPWTGVLETTELPTRATQRDILIFEEGIGPPLPTTPVGEDCLYLNIVSPSTSGDPRPVLVWSHGGGFHWGAGEFDTGDATMLLRNDVVIVTFNYRLGALGFLDLSSLLGDDYATSGNCGLLDQFAALRWVKENIAAFGGDPNRIAFGGISAGGRSVLTALSSPATEGLIDRAVVMSAGGVHVASAADAAHQAELFIEALGIRREDAAEVLTCSTDRLLDADEQLAPGIRGTWIWRPVVDGVVVTGIPEDLIRDGCAAGIPMLAGATIDETITFELVDEIAIAQAPRVMREIFGDDADRVAAAYAAARPSATERERNRAFMSDERYVASTIRTLDAQSRHADVWRYRSDFRLPWYGPVAGGHGSDVQLFFGSDGSGGFTPERQALADASTDAQANPLAAHPQYRALGAKITTALAAFLHGGAPAADGLPEWPRYDTERRATMVLDLEPKVVDDPDAAIREAWGDVSWASTTWWELGLHAVAAGDTSS